MKDVSFIHKSSESYESTSVIRLDQSETCSVFIRSSSIHRAHHWRPARFVSAAGAKSFRPPFDLAIGRSRRPARPPLGPRRASIASLLIRKWLRGERTQRSEAGLVSRLHPARPRLGVRDSARG